MLHKTRVAIRFRAKKKQPRSQDPNNLSALTDYPKFFIGMPVVRTDGRVRSLDYQIFWDG